MVNDYNNESIIKHLLVKASKMWTFSDLAPWDIVMDILLNTWQIFDRWSDKKM